MSASRGGALPLLAIAVLFAIGTGALVLFHAPREPGARVGAIVPAFALDSLGGDAVELAGLRGRVLFVNFWATWCPPCRVEAPSLERLYASLRAEGFEILAVSIDGPGSREQIDEFRREFNLSFPILLDPGKDAYASFGATGVPETFMIDARGRLAEHYIGPRDWDEPRYARAVKRLLSAAPELEEAKDG